jgi:VWFA-related protein
MRQRLIVCTLSLAFALAASAADEAAPHYTIQRPESVFVTTRPVDGRNALFVTLQFHIRDSADNRVATDITKDEIVVEEDGQRVSLLDVRVPSAEPLKTVLALDISGSMAAESKWAQAQEAAHTFLNRLDPRSDSGLILFDHEMRVRETPTRDRTAYAAHRDRVRGFIDQAKPGGGTAYLDAAALAVEMLKDVEGRRAAVVMTDGVDMNSTKRLDQVIKLANAAKVPVYTLGIGEPGKNEPVTTILVLDQSGSMRQRANPRDRMTKFDALKMAATRFVELMRPNARTTLLPFSTEVERPGPFTADKDALKQVIRRLPRPDGGTSLYDAAFVGVETLAAARPGGKKALVVLTDGQDEDPGSKHSDDDVIESAKTAGVVLHMLGLGRPQEIDEVVMKKMANGTGGTYHHAGDPQQLIDVFEQLCIDLHDDGIDEESLRKLASKTGGRYVPARDVSKLSELFGSLADELQSTYTVTFPSSRPAHDGTARGIEIRVVRGGVQVSDVAAAGYHVHGVVVPEMDAGIYLTLLVALLGLLAAPAAVRRLARPAGKPNAP